jgi:hypothetical protein
MKPHQEIAFKVTAWFECGENIWNSVSGNFDGMGLSFGPRQNNFGQGSLQPLLKKADKLAILEEYFPPEKLRVLRSILDMPLIEDQTKKVISYMNDQSNHILTDWKLCWVQLGSDVKMQAIIMNDAEEAMKRANELCSWIAKSDVQTVRMYCLAYDIINQNGNLPSALRMLLTTIKPFLIPFKKTDRDWMLFVAWARGMWTDFRGNSEWADDVADRKRAIVKGQLKFRGDRVNLDQKFGVSDSPIQQE